MKVPDEDGLLPGSTIKAMNTPHALDQSRGWPICVSAFAPRPASDMHDEPNLHIEFYQRTVTDEIQSSS